ncbi:hypothetical protein FJT64_011623 [Amphibalanus amphitrite]|uniref:WSC domain-containing protein n=1 Tax=Amphibalanus amphitrite TaxID=1232801 RepID=A0A6A4V908_AMPAM|nr:hypothetical protein FJT64_011623 [Amphibalanus amphitrite]
MHDIDSNPGLRQRPDGDFNWKYEQPTQGALNYFSSIRLSEWANATVTNRDPDHSCLSVPGLSNKLIASDCAEGKAAMCVAKADSGCPAGFLRTGSACVYGSQRPSTFAEAQASCRSLNSELYEPREPGLLADVRELVAKVHSTSHWIGMQEKTSECFYFMDRHSTSQRDAQKRCAAVGGALAEFREESYLTNLQQWRGDDNKRTLDGHQRHLRELVGDAVPTIDPEGACFLDDPYPNDPDFRVSPGDYDPTQLSPDICKVRCQALKFMYAGVKNGMFCLCSSVLRIERVSASLCSVPCTDGSGETCGGEGEYVQVYRTGGKVSQHTHALLSYYHMHSNVGECSIVMIAEITVFTVKCSDLE